MENVSLSDSGEWTETEEGDDSVTDFEPLTGKDFCPKTQDEVSTRLMVISGMTKYESKSLEELRIEDAFANRKQPSSYGLKTDGTTSTENSIAEYSLIHTNNSSFTNPFGQTATMSESLLKNTINSRQENSFEVCRNSTVGQVTENCGRRITIAERDTGTVYRVEAVCVECGKADIEADLQICKTCTLTFCDTIESYAKELYSKNSNLDSIAICPACAIRKHMKNGHEVCDFYPILSSIQFATYSESLLPKREKNQKKANDLKRSMDKMLETVDEGEKELDRMTDMIKRKKNSFLQQNLYLRIGFQIDNNHRHIRHLSSIVDNYDVELKKMIAELKSKNNNDLLAEGLGHSLEEEVSKDDNSLTQKPKQEDDVSSSIVWSSIATQTSR